MIEKVLNRKNLYKAYRQVVRNKGSAGVDGMKVTELFSYLESNRDSIATSILNHTYVPKPIKGVEIPKSNGKTRLLGVPTAVERWLQQAVSQVLMTKYELTFEEHNYGFRPEKNIHHTGAEKHQRWLSGHCGHRPQRVLRRGRPPHPAPTDLSTGKMPDHSRIGGTGTAAYPKMAPCAHPDQRKTAQA